MKTATEMGDLLSERGLTHGSFVENAAVAQTLKQYLRGLKGWDSLRAEQKEALDLICLKLSRIMSGKSNYKDHWDDIAGYAKLGSTPCE